MPEKVHNLLITYTQTLNYFPRVNSVSYCNYSRSHFRTHSVCNLLLICKYVTVDRSNSCVEAQWLAPATTPLILVVQQTVTLAIFSYNSLADKTVGLQYPGLQLRVTFSVFDRNGKQQCT